MSQRDLFGPAKPPIIEQAVPVAPEGDALTLVIGESVSLACAGRCSSRDRTFTAHIPLVGPSAQCSVCGEIRSRP